MKLIELFVAKDGLFFESKEDCIAYESSLPQGEVPYLYKGLNQQEKTFNPKFDNNAPCECGHPYHRHFDSYENNDAVGCKYCQCYHFKLAKENHNHKGCDH